jgi:class 3 adenylate cyclase
MATEERRAQMVRVASYLRHNPTALSKSAEEIAEFCQVDVDLVRNALSASKTQSAPSVHLGIRSKLKRLNRRMDNFLARIEPYNTWIVGISTLIMVLLIIFTGGFERLNGRQANIQGESYHLVFLLVVFSVHLLLYFHYGKTRHALWGALVFWGVLSVVFSTFFVIPERDNTVNPAIITTIITFAFLFLSLFYCGIAIGSSLLGAYRRLQVDKREERELTRQELLERLFEIEEALEVGQLESYEADPEWMMRIRQVAAPAALPIGFSFGLLYMVASAFVPTPSGEAGITPAFLVVYVGFFGLVLAGQAFLAFLGGGILRSMAVSLLYGAGGLIGQSLLYWVATSFRLTSAIRGSFSPVQPSNIIINAIISIIFGFFAGLGAFVHEQTTTERRRRLNDPEILLSDLITTQRRLNPDASVKCVAVFDAAKSSMMKANSDALTAEWSFRAYQDFIRHIVEKNKGTVHSTAGDGAVAVFPDCASGFQAAREVQTYIAEFNKSTNKLPDPFRLRVGLHCDTVAGDLGEVQFAAVIDVAAHTEAASQVGGIAVTESVKAYLTNERFAELPDLIDGYKAYIALEPQLESA